MGFSLKEEIADFLDHPWFGILLDKRESSKWLYLGADKFLSYGSMGSEREATVIFKMFMKSHEFLVFRSEY